MDLNTLKNLYAQEQGYDDWDELRKELYGDVPKLRIEDHMNEICIRAQKEALEKAAEKAKMKIKDDISELSMMDDWSEIDRTSITNPENLIR